MKLILLIALILLPVFALLFYWYEWRPSAIRRECDSYALSKAKTGEVYDWLYARCLHNKGLK
jgi:hypothetical protein